MDILDAIVIGSGQSGGPLAIAMARAGWKTALIEEKHVGGTCINEGCTPTKTMVASAKVAYLARRAEDFGIQAGPVQVNMLQVRQRKRDIVESFRIGNETRIKAGGVDLVMGRARFTGAKTIEVSLNSGGIRLLMAEKILINTGGRPYIQTLDGLESVRYLDSTSIMELDVIPSHLVILGGGYVGTEFGQMFRRFGSRVTILQKATQLLADEDQDISDAVAQILGEDGIDIWLGAETQRVDRDGNGGVRLVVNTAGKERILTGSHLLVSAGRRLNTDQLNLPAAGVETDSRGFILVNSRLETNVAGIYALGDVKGGPAFTHISYDDYRILKANLLEGRNNSMEGRLVPYTLFTDPQLGRVGLTERQAREQGFKIRVGSIPMNYVARALEMDQARGMMKVVVDANTNQILGCAILGLEGGEIMAMIEIAILGKVPYTTLRDSIFAHPTLAESLNNLFASVDEN